MKTIKNWILKHLLTAVILEDVVTSDKYGNIYLNGVIATENELKVLKEEVRALKEFRIWSIFENSLKEQAQRKIFIESKSYDDMYAGKMMLYNLDVMNKIMQLFENKKR